MNSDNGLQPELESQIHSLLCGGLDERRRQEALQRIVRDDDARTILGEMLDLQMRARAAFGYGRAEPVVAASLAALHRRLAESAGEPGRELLVHGSPPARRVGWIWLGRAAAAVAVVVSLFLAGKTYDSSRRLRRELSAGGPSASAIAASMNLTEADVARCRRMWHETAGGEDLWLLLSNGGGEFGSMAGDEPPSSNTRRLLLVRYRIVDAAGRTIYKGDLLLPDRPLSALSLPAAGLVAGEPVTLHVATIKDQARVGVSIGQEDRQGEAVGIVGQMSVGAAGEEIGKVQLGRQDVWVFVTTRRLSELPV